MEDAVRESHKKKPRKFAFPKRSFCLRLMNFSFRAEALSTRETSHFVHILFILPIYLNIDEIESCGKAILVISCPSITRYPTWYTDGFNSNGVTPILNHMASRAGRQAAKPQRRPKRRCLRMQLSSASFQLSNLHHRHGDLYHLWHAW